MFCHYHISFGQRREFEQGFECLRAHYAPSILESTWKPNTNKIDTPGRFLSKTARGGTGNKSRMLENCKNILYELVETKVSKETKETKGNNFLSGFQILLWIRRIGFLHICSWVVTQNFWINVIDLILERVVSIKRTVWIKRRCENHINQTRNTINNHKWCTFTSITYLSNPYARNIHLKYDNPYYI